MSETTNNIYIKLQNARVRLQESKLKKSGENKFAGFKYFELGDFLPTINKIFEELKLCSFINFTTEEAKLIIINSEKTDETIEFTCPVVELSLKGANAIQNLGGTQTYLRRYLYMNALEIVENDEFDATLRVGLSDKQLNRLFAIGKSKGIEKSTIIAQCIKEFKVSDISNMTKEQYENICDRLDKVQK